MSSGSVSRKFVNGETKKNKQKENVGHGYGVYGKGNENERGAAGSPGLSSSVILLPVAVGDTLANVDIVVGEETGTTVSSTASNRCGGRGGGSGCDNGGSGSSFVRDSCNIDSGGGCSNSNSSSSSSSCCSSTNSNSSSNSSCSSSSSSTSSGSSNSGVCVTGFTAGGVVGVQFCDVSSDRRIVSEDIQRIRSRKNVNGGRVSGETCVHGSPLLSLNGNSIDTVVTSIVASTITSIAAGTTINSTTDSGDTVTVIERDDRTATAILPTRCYEDEGEEDNDEEEDDNNMVAAMNEHLSTTSATSGVRGNTVSTSNVADGSIVDQNNTCSRNEFDNVDEDGKPTAAGILSFPCDFDHMYASMTDGGAPAAATATSALGVSPLRGNEPRHNDLTEVKHLKELLLLHLDLIQQQSEQIVTKDKLLAALRQENETLKLRLERMDRRVNLQKLRSETNENSIAPEHIGACSPNVLNSVNVPSTSDLHRNIQSENNNSQYNESFKIRLNTSGGITTLKQEPNDNQIKHEVKIDVGNDARLDWEEKKKRRIDPAPLSVGSKRKRGVSCSSNISNDASSTIQDKTLTPESNRKSDRKGKLLGKKESFLTTEEHYYTAVGDLSYTLSLKEPNPVESNTSLEVPNWRVKVYTSCYTMEGTENLDDEIFNKRHLKLENDERRRKRWDVQRIREQRHIEKLKQRQERQNHQATCYNTNHSGPCHSAVEEETVSSLWPDIEQIQSLQVDPQLPVTAFGAPVPSFTPSEFSLPWTSNTSRSSSRRPKRSTGRRKSTRR